MLVEWLKAIKDRIQLQNTWNEEDVITGKVIANGMSNPILHLWDKGRHLIDKKVKVIVIEKN